MVMKCKDKYMQAFWLSTASLKSVLEPPVTGPIFSFKPEHEKKKEKKNNRVTGYFQTPVFEMADKENTTGAEKADEFLLLMRLAGGPREREKEKV